jgi:SAM-dependent methyltransferase
MNTQLAPSIEQTTPGTTTGATRLPNHRTQKSRAQFISVLQKSIDLSNIDVDATTLVIGGLQEDANVLRACKFTHITLSNIEGVSGNDDDSENLPILALDAEDIQLPNDSYDIVFAHEVLHHCRSPHRALCEMLRVAKQRVLIMEPNDSAFMNLLCRLRFSFPFEIVAVVHNDYVRGGVRNSNVPNFIYRWSAHEVSKAASAFLAERPFSVYSDPYWDFNVDEKQLARRQQTRIGMITRMIGARNFIRMLHAAQAVLNTVGILRRQGNKFYCCIEKSPNLRPWLLQQDGEIVFNRSFQRKVE